MSTVVNRIIKYKRNLSAEERMRSVQNVLYPKFINFSKYNAIFAPPTR